MDRRCRLIKFWLKKRYPPYHTSFLFVLCILVFESGSTVTIHIPPTEDEMFYNYFATAVSHFSASHLLSNISGILLFGTILEIVHGTLANVFIFWIASGTGVLAEVVFNNKENSIYTGASSGVYGLIGAYLSHLVLNWNEAPLRLIWITFLFLQTLEVCILYWYDEEYRQTVAHFAHLFGFVQGFLVGLITLRNVRLINLELIIQGLAIVGSATCVIIPTILIYKQLNYLEV